FPSSGVPPWICPLAPALRSQPWSPSSCPASSLIVCLTVGLSECAPRLHLGTEDLHRVNLNMPQLYGLWRVNARRLRVGGFYVDLTQRLFLRNLHRFQMQLAGSKFWHVNLLHITVDLTTRADLYFFRGLYRTHLDGVRGRHRRGIDKRLRWCHRPHLSPVLPLRRIKTPHIRGRGLGGWMRNLRRIDHRN